jgi:type IV secretory pathway protease TraF
MSPTLEQGDVVLVRKADAGFLINLVRNAIFGTYNNQSQDDDMDDDASSSMFLTQEQRRIRQYEMAVVNAGNGTSSGGNGHSSANVYENPPVVIAGQVVVLVSPDAAFPTEFIVKRVVGVGGQWLQVPPAGRIQYYYPMMHQQQMQLLLPYTLYVQGDNNDVENASRDSRHYGPISKNLVIGVAEYVVWPPTRWQRIPRRHHNRDDDDDARRRRVAFWR